MRDTLVGFWSGIREWWTAKSKSARILLLGSLALILGTSLFVVMWLNHTDYIVLYDNLSVAENAGVLAQLQEMGVEGKLEGTRLLIPAQYENTVRMNLAVRGYPDSGFGYETFAMGSGLTSTQYQQTRYDTFNQQERLQAMIRTFPEVKDAHVTISMPESDLFVLQEDVQEPSVAVKIEKMPGRSLSADQVQGILNLVRASVPNLKDENISIVDESGDMRDLLLFGGDRRTAKLELTEQINETIRRRVLNMLIPLYGEGNVDVRVNAVLDTNQSTTETITYSLPDPENPEFQLKDYEEFEYERTASGQVAQGVPGANDNTNIPQYAAQLQDDGAGDYYRSHVIYDYLIPSERNQIIKEGLEITDVTVAVLINEATLPTGRLGELQTLVARAAGIADDIVQNKVSVYNIPFKTVDAVDPGPPVAPNRVGLIIAVVVLLLAFLIILTLLLAWMSRKKRREQEMDVIDYDETSLAELLGREDEFTPIQLQETQEQKLKSQIKDLADSDPEIVAQLIKTWLISA